MARFMQTAELPADFFTASLDSIAAMAAAESNKMVRVLLVEHSSEHSDRVKQSLREAGVDCRIHRVADLIEAMAYLLGDMPYLNAPRPDFVIVGQSQEHLCCCELLSEVRQNPRFAKVQTVGVKDSLSQRLPPGEAAIPFACCDLNRVNVDRIGDSIRELGGRAVCGLKRSCG